MTRPKDLCHPETVRVAASHQAEAEEIAAELAAIAATGMVLPGSITERRTRCGRRNCGCHADPPRLHGPYWQWTRKVAAKTVCRWLSTDQHDDYQAWIDNDRRLPGKARRLAADRRRPPARDIAGDQAGVPGRRCRIGSQRHTVDIQ